MKWDDKHTNGHIILYLVTNLFLMQKSIDLNKINKYNLDLFYTYNSLVTGFTIEQFITTTRFVCLYIGTNFGYDIFLLLNSCSF